MQGGLDNFRIRALRNVSTEGLGRARSVHCTDRHDPAMLFTVTAHSKECREDGILLLERLEGLAAFAAERQSSSRDPA